MSLRKSGVALGVALAVCLCAAPANAVLIAEFDFEQAPSGTSVTNLGVGPDGVLADNATVADGVLTLENVDLSDVNDPHGMSIPLGELNPFGGDADWRVSLDFSSEDGGGSLFSSDGGLCPDDCNDAEQAGSLNIFLNGGGSVVADAWFIGAMVSDGGLNDGETHNVEVSYTAEESLWELFVDEELAGEQVWEYSRDATADRTIVGGLSNPDFGFEIDGGMDALAVSIDNFQIEAPSPPPVILTVDRDTGAVSVESISAEDLNFNSLSVSSDSGSFDPAAWASITGNLDGAGDSSVSSSNWEISAQTAEELSEGGDGGTLTPGQSISLGEGLWLPSPIEDVGVELFDTGAEESVRGAINFTGTPLLFGDLNLDGEVSLADWDAFVAGFGQNLSDTSGRDGYFLGDLNGDGVHDGDDFIEFSIAFDDANGAGAFAALATIPEPAGISMFGLGAIVLLSFRRRSLVRKVVSSKGLPMLLVAFVAVSFVAVDSAHAELLVEYTFDSDASDSSGNNRDGEIDSGIDIGFGDGMPEVADGQLNLTGNFLEGVIIPLEDANPFDGSSDFTIDIGFTAGEHEDGAGQLLISSADFDRPTEGDFHSMSVFVEPEGDIVYDNFFVGEVRVTPSVNVLDAERHDLRITYSAPVDAEDPEEPGQMFMRVDGTWLAQGEIAPNVPDIANHEVRLGSSLNEDFPFECGEGECFIREFLGSLDDVRIYDEAFVPTEMRAEVDRATGDVKLIGGEFARDVKYYELSSEGGAINSAAWSSANLDGQNLDAAGDGSGQSWTSLTAEPGRVVEAFLLGSTNFGDGQEVNLAGTWGGGAEDLALQIVTTSNEAIGVEVTFVGEGSGNQGAGGGPDLATACAAGSPDAVLDALGLVAGDLDGDGEVAFADFLALSQNFGSTEAGYQEGDIDCDGEVAFADFLTLSQNFGQTSGAAASVPEPSSAVLLGPAILLGLAVRRRR